MGFKRSRGRLESECLTIISYLLEKPFNLAQMSRDLGWTKERLLGYVHPNRWKPISIKELQNWREYHWANRGNNYKFQYGLYKFALDTLRRRSDGKGWEFNRSKLPILKHYAQKHGYNVVARETENGIYAEVVRVTDMTEKYLIIHNAITHFAAVEQPEIDSIMDELGIDDIEHLERVAREAKSKGPNSNR